MIRSSASLTADDVSIRCKVRRSPFASQPEFQEPMDMLCTMRNWRSPGLEKSGSSASRASSTILRMVRGNTGAELLLSPILSSSESLHSATGNPLQLSERFQSFGSGSGSGHIRIPRLRPCKLTKTRSLGKPFSIPTEDIVVVDVHGDRESSEPIYLTTISSGYFEFCFTSDNAHGVLLAFLTASLPAERISRTTYWSDDARSASVGEYSYDVETLTAINMKERLRSEPWSEKMRRRLLRITDRLEEISVNMADTVCTCGHPPGPPPRRGGAENERRQSPPRDLGVNTQISPRIDQKEKNRMPSTLSLEPAEMLSGF